MNEIDYQEIYDSELAKGAIFHTHLPFLKDYITLHLLLRKHKIKSVFEIGTHIGEGTKIICNAVPDAKVYSLDLPTEKSEKTLQHPRIKNMVVGEICDLPYEQLYGDSMNFDYSKYPADAYFVDGEHDYSHPRHETTEAIKQKPKLIIWHDADMQDVNNAITDSFLYNADYNLYRVIGTAIAYAIRNQNHTTSDKYNQYF